MDSYNYVFYPYTVCCRVLLGDAWIPNGSMCLCFFLQGVDLYLGIVLNTKENLPKFLEIFLSKLARGLVPYGLVTTQVGS